MKAYLAAAALAVFSAIPAFSQQCGDTETFLSYIKGVPEKPEPVFEGMIDGSRIEIWADTSGRFLIVIHGPEGITCSVAAGEGATVYKLPPNV